MAKSESRKITNTPKDAIDIEELGKIKKSRQIES